MVVFVIGWWAKDWKDYRYATTHCAGTIESSLFTEEQSFLPI